ncbi:Brp/Blh family beta-carotene 15,15'-dioxygenase [Winogradskyella sp. PE311]|uniref:Brp/Blh family beta-carotene 15,15'-dioxygenase n=1 Tax=Winogradskyella sp. PE311 TaxID=3366943 RepID=UPI003980C033
MKNITNISIVLSFVGLWLSSLLAGQYEIIVGFFFIFTFGILHGSNDVLLITSFENQISKNTFPKILTGYLFMVLIAVAIFYYLPILALVLFIVFSAFHFGEQHWEEKISGISKYLRSAFYFVYGQFILLLLFQFNKKDVIDVIYSITNYHLNENTITQCFIYSSIVFGLLLLILILNSKAFKKLIAIELLYLLIFSVIFKVSTLIWGFTIYFVFWHSLPSLYDQISYVYGESNKKNILRYCKNALPYWAISIIGIALVYFIFKDENIFYAVFFSFIAAVTFPHSIVINKMFKHKKSATK